ncbi:hypothetical protein O0544_23130 [Edwardsiella anguillarum]|nr:hypothetical protein [Edwardsiella anguillarum]
MSPKPRRAHSHLDDSVYLVGYSTATERANRDGIYITTNTGRTIQVYDAPSYGYTSMTKDEDNLYILFEGEGISIFSAMTSPPETMPISAPRS